jgi:fructose/tagatose bisphosphate aldolase
MPAGVSYEQLDASVIDLALSPAGERQSKAKAIRRQAADLGIYPSAIGRIYRAMAERELSPMTVPAVNLRGLTYELARAVFRAARRVDGGPVIFELAPSESEVTDQSFAEYCAQVLAAAVREGHSGPVFLQGDHFEVSGDSDPDLSLLLERSRSAVSAGMLQLDLDAAGLADDSGRDPAERQGPNAIATATMLAHLRQLAWGDELVIGGEVGEIGGANTTPEELLAFLSLVIDALPAGVRGLDKVSVQTGTRHGGVVERDGSVGSMPLDLDLIAQLSEVARREFGFAGVVQHGASTLSLAQLARLPEAGVIEVHLATGIQNLVLDHPALPGALVDRMKRELDESTVSHAESGHYEMPADLSERQRFVMNRWKAWGRYKRELWALETHVKDAIGSSMEEWVIELLTALKVAGKGGAVAPHLPAAGGART